MTVLHVRKLQSFYMITVSSVAIVAALIYTRPVLMPLIFAVFYYFASLPAVHFLEKTLKIPRVVALLLTSAAASSLFMLVFLQISVSLRELVPSLDLYRDSSLQIVDTMSQKAQEWGVLIDRDFFRELLTSFPIKSYGTKIVGDTLGILGSTILVIVIYFFLMMSRSGPNSSKWGLIGEIESKVSKYVLIKFILSTLTGFLMALILFGFGVDLALMFGFLALILNFIPSLGSIVATLLPVPIIALKYGFGLKLVVILLLCSIVQVVIGSIIDPKVVGRDLDLHPIVIILSLVFWGIVWGVGGMFLAVPLTVTLKLVLSQLEPTRKLSELLAGRL